AALFATALQAGCDGGFGQSTAKVYGQLNLIDRAGYALNSVGTLVAVDGVYGDDCQYRSTSGGFSLPLGDYLGTPEGARLAIRCASITKYKRSTRPCAQWCKRWESRLRTIRRIPPGSSSPWMLTAGSARAPPDRSRCRPANTRPQSTCSPPRIPAAREPAST